MRLRNHSAACLKALFFSLICATPLLAQTIVRPTASGHQLFRDGAPFRILGIGGDEHLALLSSMGGNAIRTWSVDRLGETLDAAQRHGLVVCAGIWMGHPRHGFDYQDEAAVLDQLNDALAAVQQYKDHPALLMWAVGNEMEGSGENPAIWYAVDHVAREIKALDPNHPTMTVIAELGDHKLRSIDRFCPNIDIVGINSYGGIVTLAERVAAAKIDKPYIVTEHGPLGPWEVEKTAWGAPLEPTSTAKASHYAEGYRATAVTDAPHCLGTFAFLWGHKQETTATWFGMLLPDGSRLEAVDQMSRQWIGKYPANRCPQIKQIVVDAATHALKPGALLHAEVVASDPEQDSLTYEWILSHDSLQLGVGGDHQSLEKVFAEAVKTEGPKATVTIPSGGGGYRLFVTVRDGQGGAAVANQPLYVDAPEMTFPASPAELPFTVYGEQEGQQVFVPSGFMGNTSALSLETDCATSPYAGESCIKAQYDANSDWGGVLWQSPANDWEGKLPGGLDFSDARELTFWARGEEGGEVVNFLMGAIEGPGRYRDTSRTEMANVQLTKSWKQYRIPLQDRDLSRIKTAFGWSVASQGKPITFYLDEVQYQ